MSLLHGKPKRLVWNPAAETALTQLKTVFTIAPILKHPDPSKVFIVEVDASEMAVRAILSQSFGDKPKLQPVAFVLKKLSPAE